MMAHRLAHVITAASALAIRLFPLLVAGCVVVFPAYKGLALGYIPVLVGALVAGWVTWSRSISADYWTPGIGALYVMPALLQGALLMFFRPEPWFDALYVYQHAVELLQSGRMDPMTYYPPAMTWWYAGWFKLFGASTLLAQFSHIPLSLAVTWSTLRLARDVTGVESLSRRAAMVAAWYPTFLGYVLTTPYYHYLYTLCLLLMVWLIVRQWKSERTRGALFLAGLCAGMGALTKAVQLIAPLQLILWLLIMMALMNPKRAVIYRWAWGALVFGVGMILILLPWMVRNERIFHALVPVCTSGGLVLYSANHPGSNGLYSDEPDTVTLSSPAEMLAHSRWCSEQAKAFMKNEPALFAGLAWRKFLHTWGSEATFTELINQHGRTSLLIKRGFSSIFLAGWSGLVFVWATSAVKRIRHGVPLTAYEALAGVVILSNALVYVVFEGGDRHHLPLVPLILVLIASMRNDTVSPGYACRPACSSLSS